MKNLLLLVTLLGLQFNTFSQIITDSAFIHNQILNGVQNADCIFEGEVIAVESYWNSTGDYIYSSATVEVFQTWKTSELAFEENQIVEVITRGGTVGDASLSISHQLGFVVGQKGLLMADFATYPANPNSTVSTTYQFQPHDGLYFDYDYSKNYISSSFASIDFDCIDILYEIIDTNYVVECLQITPNGTLQTQTYNQMYSSLNGNAQSASRSSGTVTYTFENAKTTSSSGKSFFEYDIFISATNGPYFQQGLARIKYDTTAFQSNIVNSNKITVQRGSLIASVVDYMPPAPADVAPNVVAIAFGADDTTLMSRSTFTSPVQLAHVKMEIKDCQSTPNLSFADTTIMKFITLYNSSSLGGTNEGPANINAADTENSNLCQMTITGFSPTTVNGGTGDIVTIAGSLFGTTQGTVQLRNTDGNGAKWVTLDPYDITQWTDTEIKIRVPSTLPITATQAKQLRTPGSGKIKIINQNGTSEETNQDLEIYYSWKNGFRRNVSKHKVFLAGIDSVWDENLQNQQLGNSFVLNPNIANNSGANECVIKAVKDWVCATEVRWQVDNTTSALPVFQDSISTIQFGSTSASNVLGETQVFYFNCGAAGGGDMGYTTDIDIVISNLSSHNWLYDSSGTQNQAAGDYDFYSVILHELGHGHLLKHINDPQDLMYFESKHDNSNSIPWSSRKTIFSLSNLDGGSQIITESENADYSNCQSNEYPMIRLHKDNCSIATFNNPRKAPIVDKKYKAFPNPFNEEIMFDISLNNSQPISIKIFDIKGELIREKTHAPYSKGNHIIKINSSEIDQGFYIGVISIGSEQFPVKLIKQ